MGEVSSRAAAETGLRAGIPVIAGGPDTQCGLLGMDVAEPGEVGILVGWSGPLQMVTSTPILDPQRRTWTGRHLLPDAWVVESSTTEAGHSLDWAKKALNLSDEELTADAFDPKDYNPLAFLGPRIMDAKALGIQTGGFLFPTPIGHTAIPREALAGAALKNLAFAIRGNFGQLEEVAGARASIIAVGGGGHAYQRLPPACRRRPGP